jgi:hypothetical protein
VYVDDWMESPARNLRCVRSSDGLSACRGFSACGVLTSLLGQLCPICVLKMFYGKLVGSGVGVFSKKGLTDANQSLKFQMIWPLNSFVI